MNRDTYLVIWEWFIIVLLVTVYMMAFLIVGIGMLGFIWLLAWLVVG